MAEVERMMAADKEVQRRIEQSLEGYSRLESQMMVGGCWYRLDGSIMVICFRYPYM